jgi:hypothetical protein
MHSNGVVSFMDPRTNAGPANWAYCCEGIQASQLTPQFNYMIAPLWTDLYPVGQSRFRTQGDSTFQRYSWENIAEISNMSNLNTFGLEIRPSGSITNIYSMINIQNQNVFAGTIGDVSLGEYNQVYYGRGIPNGALQNWSMNETIAGDRCAIDPLSSPTCAGYAAAYLSQQCSYSALYDPSCPGYASAYFTQQCNANQLYNQSCPGYAAAYLTQQCSANPLYSTTCSGYQQAYFDQQCSISGLYSTSCPNYADAYFAQQCSLNGLYNTQCPNYADAYATKMALEASKTVSNPAVVETTAVDAPSVNSSGETKVALVADSNVNAVITSTSTSASPATAATTAVPLVAAPAPAQTTTATVAASREEKKEENKETSTSESTSSSPTTASASADDKKEDKPKTARQELQERRQAAAKAQAVEQGKNLANEMGNATSMEQQAAVQNVVIQAMGFTPGFDAYGKANIVDVVGYKPYTIYNNQRNVDNRLVGARLFGGTDNVHRQMVDSQYQQ